MKLLLKINLLLFSCAFYFSCTKDNAVTETPPPPIPTAQNLISNGSFENSGQASLQGWYRYKPWQTPPLWILADTSYPYFHQYKSDVPSGGGNWSLQINGGVDFQASTGIVAIITGQNGTGTYQLTGWAKAVSPVCLGGVIALGKKSGIINWKNTSLDTTYNTWKKYTVIDTLTISTTDTILVRLTSLGAGPCGDSFEFDLIELNRLD